jgi:hypothetical protein
MSFLPVNYQALLSGYKKGETRHIGFTALCDYDGTADIAKAEPPPLLAGVTSASSDT